MKMRVLYRGRNPHPDVPFECYGDLESMARAVDWLVVRETERIVSRSVLEALGPQGHFVNMARGSLVDQDALLILLASSRSAARPWMCLMMSLTCDVVWPRQRHPLPPQGSATTKTPDAMGALIVANIEAHFGGRPLLTAVVQGQQGNCCRCSSFRDHAIPDALTSGRLSHLLRRTCFPPGRRPIRQPPNAPQSGAGHFPPAGTVTCFRQEAACG
jgi:hypothetical protein